MARIKFQIDEHVSRAVAAALRRRGADVITSREAGLIGAPDTVQFAHTQAKGRVIVTQDSDFLRFQGDPHAGIAYCKQQTRTTSELVSALILIYEILEAEDMIGRVEYL